MHMVVSWDIAGTGETWNSINEQMLQVIKPYPWVRPVNTFYVLRIDNELIRKSIINQLQLVAKRGIVPVNFVAGPLMQGGLYEGYLHNNLWEALNEMTR